jgi:hypothetical protein
LNQFDQIGQECGSKLVPKQLASRKQSRNATRATSLPQRWRGEPCAEQSFEPEASAGKKGLLLVSMGILPWDYRILEF